MPELTKLPETLPAEDVGPLILLRIEEAGRLLRLSRSRMFELLARDGLPGVVRIGRSVRISRVALEAWIEERVASDGGQDAA